MNIAHNAAGRDCFQSLASASRAVRSSEFQPERQLAGPIAPVPHRLHAGRFSERVRRRNVGGGRKEIRVIQKIGETRLKTQLQTFDYEEVLRKPSRHRDGSWAFKNSHARIADATRPGWRRNK